MSAKGVEIEKIVICLLRRGSTKIILRRLIEDTGSIIFETDQHDWFTYNFSFMKSLKLWFGCRSLFYVFNTFAYTSYYNCHFNFPNSSTCLKESVFHETHWFILYIFLKTVPFETFTGTWMFTWCIFHHLAFVSHQLMKIINYSASSIHLFFLRLALLYRFCLCLRNHKHHIL